MKRFFAVILALFMLLSSAALSEEPATTTEPLPFASQEAEARAYADAMQERFNITILIGDMFRYSSLTGILTKWNC